MSGEQTTRLLYWARVSFSQGGKNCTAQTWGGGGGGGVRCMAASSGARGHAPPGKFLKNGLKEMQFGEFWA